MSEEYLIKRVNYYDNPDALEEVMRLQEFMPEYLREEKERIISNLKDPRNINMFMKEGSGEVFCYAFASPQNYQLVSEFMQDDPLMPVDEGRYYVDQVVAREDARRGFSFFSEIVLSVFKEANKMGFYKFSVHALCNNGVDRLIARVFRKYIYSHRKVTLSHYGGAEYMYMEAFYGLKKEVYRSAFTAREIFFT